MNCGIIGGSLSTIAKFYERQRSVLRETDLLVVNVDDWQINAGRVAAVTKGQDEQGSSLLRDCRRRIDVLHENLTHLACNAIARFYRQDEAFKVTVTEDNQMFFAPLTDVPGKYDVRWSQSVIDDYYSEFAFDAQELKPLEQILEGCRQDGVRVVLVQMPNEPNHQTEVLRRVGDLHRRQLAHLREFAENRGVPFYDLNSATECGLTSDCFADGVHLRPTGAKEFSRHLAALIRREKLLD
ncbi:MAG: hypothetical protein QM775_05690 [Pirellulales bacterium]